MKGIRNMNTCLLPLSMLEKIERKFPYSRILVIGSPGAGKSTLSRRLGHVLNLPVVHLDLLWHLPDQTTVSQECFDQRLDSELRKPEWIIDGNFLRTIPQRMKRADLILFLDYPAELCIRSVEGRVGKKRADMPWVEMEVDPEFREYIEKFPEIRRPQILALLKEAEENQNLIALELQSREEADALVSILEKLEVKQVNDN